MRRLKFRFPLRVAILAVTLMCTLLAWMSYRNIVQQYGRHTDRVNVQTRLEAAESRLSDLRRFVDENRGERQREWQTDLLSLEAEKAICELKLAGFDISERGLRGHQVSVHVGQRELSGEQVRFLRDHLKTIHSFPFIRISSVDLTGTKCEDIVGLASDIELLCPECKVKR